MNNIRYTKDIIIEKMAIHIVEGSADKAIISENYLFINEDNEEFTRKHVIKALNDIQNYSCREFSDKSVFSVAARKVINDHQENFLDWSKTMANHMYDTIKHTDIPACDVLCVQFITNETRCFGVLKLDYQVSNTHNIKFNDKEQIEIDLISTESTLPTTKQNLKKAIFFCKAPEDKIEMLVLDKTQKLEDGDTEYFVKDFIDAVIVSDDTEKTRNFKKTVEKWTQKNLSDQIEAANTVRSMVDEKLLSDDTIEIDTLAVEMFEQVPEIKESFLENVSDAGYKQGTNFEIDKAFIEKKMKLKTVKTDTGVTIKGEFDFFKDSQKFIIKKNGDGTVDYVIKNVRNVVEK